LGLFVKRIYGLRELFSGKRDEPGVFPLLSTVGRTSHRGYLRL
jgi:hypothetical protein